MWIPKHENNDLYVGKTARIYYTSGHHKNVEYVEGELIYIWECKTRPHAYSVQILDNDNKLILHRKGVKCIEEDIFRDNKMDIIIHFN